MPSGREVLVRTCTPSATKMPVASRPWQFVNISELDQSRDQSLRSIVRANANRQLRRRQKRSRTAALDHTSVKPGKRRLPVALVSSGFSKNSDKREDADFQAAMPQCASSDLPMEWEKVLSEVQTALPPVMRPSVECKRITNLNENACIDLRLDYTSGSRTQSSSKHTARQSLSISPGVAFGAGNRDPFNSCPLGRGAQTSELVYRCRCTYFQIVPSLRPYTGGY